MEQARRFFRLPSQIYQGPFWRTEIFARQPLPPPMKEETASPADRVRSAVDLGSGLVGLSVDLISGDRREGTNRIPDRSPILDS